ncbi:MAG TPA: hypothetical protein VFP78_23450, partial [Solirubrobacteraceae bacterium]|nr:hypothetical protein [Solirubrobacteraceae bacterium]
VPRRALPFRRGRPGSARPGDRRGRIARWDRGVDLERFSPEHRRARDDDRIEVLYAGRLTSEKGARLLADDLLAARARDPRLHLLLAGGGPAAASSARRGSKTWQPPSPPSRPPPRHGAGSRAEASPPSPAARGTPASSVSAPAGTARSRSDLNVLT